MADIKYYDVILKPVITEKSMNAMGDKKYTSMVHVDANKSMIKEEDVPRNQGCFRKHHELRWQDKEKRNDFRKDRCFQEGYC